MSEPDRPPRLDTVRRTLPASPPGPNAADRQSKPLFLSTAQAPRSDDEPPPPPELLLRLQSPSRRSWSTTGPRSCVSSPSATPTRPRHHPRRGMPPAPTSHRLATVATAPEQPWSSHVEPYHSDSGHLCSPPTSSWRATHVVLPSLPSA
jgi:hypothetical protein